MITAQEIMTKSVATIHPEKTLLDAIHVLIDKEISGLPVVDGDGNLVGIVTERDILNYVLSGNLKNKKIEDVMTRKVVSFSPEDNVDTIALIIGQHRFRRAPIIKEGKVIGIISRRDIIKAALSNQPNI